MASIKKQGRGYKITVSNGYDIHGRQIRHHMTWVPEPGLTKRQEEKELNRQAVLFEEQVTHGGTQLNGNIHLKAFSELFMRDHIRVNRKYNTFARYEREIKRINEFMGHKKLSQITPSDVTAFSAHLSVNVKKKDGSDLAPSTVNTNMRTLSSMLGYAVKWGYIGKNPALLAEGPGQVYAETPYLDEDDARLFLEKLKDKPLRWRVLISCDLISGLRRGELLGLQWPDIDFAQELVYIRRTWNYTSGRGCYLGPPKSKRSNRPVHLSPAFFSLLREYKAWQNEQQLLLGDAWKGTPGDPRVFTTEDGSPIFPTTPTWWISKFTKEIGIKHLSMHSLRHTYASLMIAEEVPLVEVSSQLGHARTSTTANLYGHVIAAAHAKGLTTFSKFDDVLASPKKEA